MLDDANISIYKDTVKTQGTVNIANNSSNVRVVLNKNRPKSYAEQSAQEVYVHELVHVVTHFGLENDEKFRTEVERIREQVIKEIENTEKRPYEIFLHRDANGKIIYLTNKDAEIESAKEQYQYVFGKPGEKGTAAPEVILDEFVAYGLTNKFVVVDIGQVYTGLIKANSGSSNGT